MIELHHGDCLDIMHLIPDKSIDMILCDLPYGTTACKWDVIIPFEQLWKHYERIIKDNGAIVLSATQPFTSALVMSNPKLFKYEWVYEKTMAIGGIVANKRPLRAHENILVFYKIFGNYNAQKEVGVPYKRPEGRQKESVVGNRTGGHITINEGYRHPRSVIKFSNPNAKSLHPTQKPVRLMEYLIKTYTNEGETVLDNCMGSGTTGVACKTLNRNFIGIEKEEKYFQIAKNRI